MSSWIVVLYASGQTSTEDEHTVQNENLGESHKNLRPKQCIFQNK